MPAPAPARPPPTLARSALSGLRLGLVAFVGLYAACALFNMELGYQGNANAALSELVWNQWRPTVLWQVARLVGAYTVLGLVLGALLGAGTWAWGARSLRAPRMAGLLGCLAVDALAVLGDMACHPHVYAATLYGPRPGVGAWVLLAVQGTRPGAWWALAALPLALAVLGLLLRALRALPRRGRRGAVVAAALAGVLGGVARAPAREAAPAPRRPNLLVLASDGLRPDRLSGAGHARPTSPHLDALLREGARFEETVVQVPRTAPGWTTLLTSQWAGEHPVRHTLAGPEARAALPPTLATALRDAGYRTAVVSDYAGDLFGRLAFGFQEVRAPRFSFPDLIRQRMLVTHVALLPFTALAPGLFPERGQFPELTDPAPLRRAALDALAHLDAGAAPFALVVFASTTHFPYAAPAPFAQRWVDPAYRGPWRFGASPLLERDAPLAPPPEDVRALSANYDAGVAAFDALAGDVLAALRARGTLDDTLVVLLSDHGEHLADTPGRGQGHGEHLWGPEALRVPFVLRAPGLVAPGRVVRGRARAVDVAPTLLELLGVPAPASFRGASLAAHVRAGAPEAPLPERPALVETDVWFTDRDAEAYQQVRVRYPWVYETARIEQPGGDISLKPEWEARVRAATHRGLYLGRWKLLELPTDGGVVVQLFDTVADPGEHVDVAAQHPGVVRALRERLRAERHWER